MFLTIVQIQIQIIRFLKMHVLANTSVTAAIPPTITDQIRLWEQVRDRFSFTEGVLYNQFLSQTGDDVM